MFRTYWPGERRLRRYEPLGGMRIEPYADHWYGLYDSQGKLICVCVYKRGCLEVMRRIHELQTELSTPKKGETT